MTTFELMKLLLRSKSQQEFINTLKTNRIPVRKSKYC